MDGLKIIVFNLSFSPKLISYFGLVRVRVWFITCFIRYVGQWSYLKKIKPLNVKQTKTQAPSTRSNDVYQVVKVLPRIELGSPDSKSEVLTITP